MSSNTIIFLSHIHEEKDLAILLKNAMEEEFSGFVDVFVSSDGISIPAGSNFLKRIEEGLVSCMGAMYLISPESVKRNWINFELGAVWIRNSISLKTDGPEIPVLPVCHSGMATGALPQPICNLNAIQANQSSQLEFAFRSIQNAVGGKGAFRTNFDELALQVISFERDYTLGANIKSFFEMLGGDIQQVIQHCESLPPGTSKTTLELGFIPTEKVQKIAEYEQNQLKGKIKLSTQKPGMSFGQHGAVNGAEASVLIDISLVLEFKELLST